MKSILLSSILLLVAISITACGDTPTTSGSQDCGTYEGFQLSRDVTGCYYMNNGRRVSAPETACSCS